VLHDARDSQGTPSAPTEVGLDGRGGRVAWQVKGRHLRFSGDLLVLRSPAGAPFVNFGGGHPMVL